MGCASDSQTTLKGPSENMGCFDHTIFSILADPGHPKETEIFEKGTPGHRVHWNQGPGIDPDYYIEG